MFFAERVSQKLTCSCRCYKKGVSRNWTIVFFALKADLAASGNAAASFFFFCGCTALGPVLYKSEKTRENLIHLLGFLKLSFRKGVAEREREREREREADCAFWPCLSLWLQGAAGSSTNV